MIYLDHQFFYKSFIHHYYYNDVDTVTASNDWNLKAWWVFYFSNFSKTNYKQPVEQGSVPFYTSFNSEQFIAQTLFRSLLVLVTCQDTQKAAWIVAIYFFHLYLKVKLLIRSILYASISHHTVSFHDTY